MTDLVLDVIPAPVAVAPVARPKPVPTFPAALSALVRRRFALSIRTPRELFVPLLTPVLFAVVIAPALDSIGPKIPGLDYMSYAAVGTAVLLIPLNCMFAGIGVIVDRESGAQRDLLAAPVPRPLMVLGNLSVALIVCSFQVIALVGAALLRGADFHTRVTGVLWFVGAAAVFAVAMYGVAETLASRITKQEEFVGVVPLVAVIPWFFAGSLFPISSLPGWLGSVAKVLPLTHTLALLRYGFIDPSGRGLHDIWGMSNVTTEAWLSLGVVALFAAALTFISIRVFSRSAVS
jgi:ABC-2 type transport system permease protein